MTMWRQAGIGLLAVLGAETGWVGDGYPRVRIERGACRIVDPVDRREDQRAQLLAIVGALPPEAGRLRLLTHDDDDGTRLSVSTLDREREPVDEDLAGVLGRWTHGPVALNGAPLSG